MRHPIVEKRGHARKTPDGKKWLPPGEYESGFARPPAHSQFKKGCKPGPGRPKGSFSHDRLLRKQLDRKRPVRIDGVERQVSTRELLVTTTVRDAVEGKSRDARKYVLGELSRLYPEAAEPAAQGPADLSASDQLSLEEFAAEIRRQVLSEFGLDEASKEGDDA